MDQLDDFELPVENCPGAEGDGIKIVMRPYSQVMSQWRNGAQGTGSGARLLRECGALCHGAVAPIRTR